MITVAEALDRLFTLARPLETEMIDLRDAAFRVLAVDAVAARAQPPFAASSMDGYATGPCEAGQRLDVIGESAAGKGFDGAVSMGQAVRIFTGAPMPEGADRVVIQENTTRDGDTVTVTQATPAGDNVRPAGGDFDIGARVVAPRHLRPSDLALLAAMNVARVAVTRRPRVALIATGNELVMPGEAPGPDQIVASNVFGLEALLSEAGAEVRLLPIARDDPASLRLILGMAADADLIVTIGGASVGDHDLVAPVLSELGMKPAFHKVAMRPGKPLMSGRLGEAMVIGLPGNPVSAMVCGHVFVLPVVRAMLGLGAAPAPRHRGVLAAPVAANGPREHYMRARLTEAGLTAFDRQDSALLTVLAGAQALIVRAPHAPAATAGEPVDYLPL